MWGTVLAVALVATADPVRIGIAVLLFSRRQPVLHLVALWLGGMTVGVFLGLGVLFGLHDLALGAMHRVQLVTTSATAGLLQVAVGVLALVVAASIAVGISARQPKRVAMPGDYPAPQAASTTPSRLLARALDVLQAGPLWITFAVGVVISTDFRYLTVLTVILASGAAVSTQISAAATYTIVALAFVEIPLACQLAAPARTRAVMSRVHDWVKARRREVLGVVVALLGVFLMTTGMGHI